MTLHGVRSRPRGTALLLVLALALTSCSGMTSKISRRFGGKARIGIEVDPLLNQDFPLAVDIVVVYDKDLFKELRALGAEEWFAQRAQYELDHEPKNLEVTSRELVPLCADCPQPDPLTLKFRVGARGGVVFSNYFNPGLHRIILEPLEGFTLKLGETEATRGPVVKLSRKERKSRKKAEAADKPKKKRRWWRRDS